MNPQNKTKHLLVIGFIVLLVMLLSACQQKDLPVDHEQLSEDERIVIRFSHIVGENTPKGVAARRFARLVKDRTDGFVEVQVFPNGYLYRDGEEMDALLKGDIQMIAPAMSKLSAIAPEWEVIDLPFAFENSHQVRSYLQGDNGKKLFQKLEINGLQPLEVWDNGLKQMTNSVRPLIEPSDFSGLRFRIMPSSVIESQFYHFNATTQVNSFNEVYQLLEKRETNAQENTFSNIVSKNLHSLQDYLTISDHGYLGYVVLMNKKFWDALPSDIQQVIEETLAEVTKWEIKRAEELNEESMKKLIECECIDIHVLTDEEKRMWEETLKPVYQLYIDRFGVDYIKSLPKYKTMEDSQ